MNLTEMRALVRRDLHDEDVTDYRWSDSEIDRQTARALKEFSVAIPQEQKVILATTAGSREISIASLTGRVRVEAVEYPVGSYPPDFQRFAFWQEVLTILGQNVPDGSDCCIYYGRLHTLDAGNSTIPEPYEDLVAAGAAGYAALQMGGYVIGRVNTGGLSTPADWTAWARDQLAFFHGELKRLGKSHRLRAHQLYRPSAMPVSRATDGGP